MTEESSPRTPERILVLNSGSSSLKFTLLSMADESMLAKGVVERIGTPSANLQYQRDNEAKTKMQVDADDHAEALQLVCDKLVDPETGVLSSLSEVEAIGHRVVHGGETFHDSIVVDEKVKKGIMECANLAPLHNPANLGGIVACERVFDGLPNIAVFDTAFHQSMPAHSFLYAIAFKYYEKYGIRKYGFHGTSHCFIMQATAEYLGKPVEELKLITCHLGNGCSVAAIDRGRVIDTSMGMTPLAGLVMGTRAGDLDPAVVLFLVRQGMTADKIDELLNKRSGLLGVGGIGSGDMRDIIDAAEEGSKRAARALKMFVHRLRMYIGGYYTLLDGADAVIMTGGIGENSIHSRGLVVQGLAALGAEFDAEANKELKGPGYLTTPNSKLPVIVMPTNEELMIARETVRVLSNPAPAPRVEREEL